MHDGDHTYSLIVPAQVSWSQTPAVQSYEKIHQALAEALVAMGEDGCRLAKQEDIVEGPLCFTAPALHDVVRGQTKIAGAGQRRGRLGILHQGSVQQVRLDAFFWRSWAARLSSAVSLVPSLPPAVSARAEELAEKRFRLPQWLSDREDFLT
jgi:lipoate-protein ligase A